MRLILDDLKISGHCSWILNYVTDLWNSGSSVNVVLNTDTSNAKNTRDTSKVIIWVRSLCEALEVDLRDLQGVSVCSWILVHRNKTFRAPEALRCERSESTYVRVEWSSIDHCISSNTLNDCYINDAESCIIWIVKRGSKEVERWCCSFLRDTWCVRVALYQQCDVRVSEWEQEILCVKARLFNISKLF